MSCYVLGFQEIDQTQIGVVGGKGAHLGELSRIEGLGVPAVRVDTAVNGRAARYVVTGVDGAKAEAGERVAHLVSGRMIDFIEFDDDFVLDHTVGVDAVLAVLGGVDIGEYSARAGVAEADVELQRPADVDRGPDQMPEQDRIVHPRGGGPPRATQGCVVTP